MYQPEICRVFAIKKNKYDPFDDSIRLLIRRFLVLRRSSARLGRGTLFWFADIRSAFKTQNVRRIFRIGDKYFFLKEVCLEM